MTVRALIRSSAALVYTALGVVAVGAVLAVGLRVAAEIGAAVDNPVLLDGFGPLAAALVVVVFLGAAALVWMPFGAGIAYAVGRGARGDTVTLLETIDAVGSNGGSLYRWVRTRVAVGPLADRLLTEDDVAPNEVVVGSTAFVVPALVLDAPTLPRAVDLANRMAPREGRLRLLVVGFGSSLVLAAVVYVAGVYAVGGDLAGATRTGILLDGGSSMAEVDPLITTAAVAALIAGGVLTVALDAAWRAEVYATQDLSDGFLD